MASLKARLVLAAVFATAVESHAGPGRFDEILKYKKAQANGDPSAVGVKLPPRALQLSAGPQARQAQEAAGQRLPDVPGLLELRVAADAQRALNGGTAQERTLTYAKPIAKPAPAQTLGALQSTCRAHSTCGECLAAPERCVWQGDGSCDSKCRVQDTICLKAELGHHCPVEGCAAHTTCDDCTKANCIFQGSVCKGSCEFGPLGKFIASCYNNENECKDAVAQPSAVLLQPPMAS